MASRWFYASETFPARLRTTGASAMLTGPPEPAAAAREPSRFVREPGGTPAGRR